MNDRDWQNLQDVQDARLKASLLREIKELQARCERLEARVRVLEATKDRCTLCGGELDPWGLCRRRCAAQAEAYEQESSEDARAE